MNLIQNLKKFYLKIITINFDNIHINVNIYVFRTVRLAVIPIINQF